MRLPFKVNDSHRRLLTEIRREQPVTRAALSRALDMNSGPVTSLTRDLLLAGLIMEGDRLKGQRGQPALPLSLNPSGAMSFGVGLAPGSVRTVAMDFTGGVIDEQEEWLRDNAVETVTAIVGRHIEAMTRKAHLTNPKRVLGVGFALPGFFFNDMARMHVVEEHRDWRSQSLKNVFETALGLPVWIENDATAAALAQSYAPEAIQSRSLVLLLVNYGIGGGAVIDGRPIRGAHGNAGEIGGYYPLQQPRPSGSDLLALLRAAGLAATTLSDIDLSDPESADIVQAWSRRAGDQLLQAVEAAWAWLDPDLVVIAGGIPESLTAALAAAIPQSLFERDLARPAPMIMNSSLGPGIVAMGAAHLPLHAFLHDYT